MSAKTEYCDNASKKRGCAIRKTCKKYMSLLNDTQQGKFVKSESLIRNMYKPVSSNDKSCATFEKLEE